MSGGRPRNFARVVKVRIAPELIEKLPFLRPEIMDPANPNQVRYGGLSRYIEFLIRADLQKIETKIK